MSLYVILITQGSSPRCLSPNKVGLSQLQANLKKPGRHEVKGKKKRKRRIKETRSLGGVGEQKKEKRKVKKGKIKSFQVRDVQWA